MSLRRGLQVIVGAVRRRVQLQRAQLHVRERPDGVPSNAGEQSRLLRCAEELPRWARNPNLSHQNRLNFAESASKIWRSTQRIRFPQANGSRGPPSPSQPILSLLLGFVGVGFVSRQDQEESGLGNPNDSDIDSGIGHVDLETAIQTIQSVFKARDRKQAPASATDFPLEMKGYAVAEDILAKGTEGVIYAAKMKEIAPSPEGDTPLSESCREESITRGVLEDGQEHTTGDIAHCDEKECNIALKMMFNYNVGATTEDIMTEFHAEQLPLLLARGKFGNPICSQNREAVSLGSGHPNVVKMYQSFVDDVKVPRLQQAMACFDMALPQRLNPCGLGADTTMYVVMKRYRSSLRDYLKDHGPLSDRSAMLIVAQLLEAVGYLGSQGIVHRDLKTNNILVDHQDGGEVSCIAVADFGCALSLRGRNLTDMVTDRERNNPGNSALMAPEVTKAYLDDRVRYRDYLKADVWAVGAIVYEVCGQENPFYSLAGPCSASYNAQSLPQLQTQAVGLRVVTRLLLQKEPSERPTPYEAADMLHLLLWQPSMGRIVRLCPGQHSQEKELVTWLMKVAMTYLLHNCLTQATPAAALGLAWSGAEEALLGLFLRRVNSDSLRRASRHLAAQLRDIVLPVRTSGRTAGLREDATWHPCPGPLVICQT